MAERCYHGGRTESLHCLGCNRILPRADLHGFSVDGQIVAIGCQDCVTKYADQAHGCVRPDPEFLARVDELVDVVAGT